MSVSNRQPFIRIGFFAILIALLILTGVSAEAQTTRGGISTVCPVGCGFTTIADAVAATATGFSILVDVNGTHTEPGTSILIDKGTTIRGLGRNQTRIVMADSTARHFIVSDEVLWLVDLTLADSAIGNSFGGGGAIAMNPDTTLILDRVGFENNSADLAGAIMAPQGTNVTISDSYFENNTAKFGGGAISAFGELEVYRSTFHSNSSEGNLADPASGGPGGAINASAAIVKIQNSTFYNNHADEGSAIRIHNSFLTMRHVTIHNEPIVGGRRDLQADSPTNRMSVAALKVEGSSATMENNIISDLTGPACNVTGVMLLSTNMATDGTCPGISYNNQTINFGIYGYRSSKMPLLPITIDSPARNKASSAAGSACAAALTQDQRGMSRTDDDTTCDLGAYEFLNAGACTVSGLVIPDGGAPLTETLNLSKNGSVLGVRVKVEATHPFVSNLSAAVSSQGQSVTLFDRPGIPTTPSGCPNDNINAHFSDEGSGFAETMCKTTGSYAIDGTLNPVTPMSAFAGLESDATWSVSIQDHSNFFVGTLDRVCVDVEYAADGFYVAPTAVTLSGSSVEVVSMTILLASAFVLLLLTGGVVFGRNNHR